MNSIHRKKGTFLLPFSIFIVGMIVFVFIKLYIQKNIISENIDLRLRSAAGSVQLIINDSIIEAANSKKPIDLIDYDNLRNTANSIAEIHEVIYVYVMIESGDSALFVLSSYINSDITDDLVTNYLDYYEEATPVMMNAFKSNNAEIFDLTSDVWGSFRSIYVPRKTKSGTPYLLCADVRVSEVFDYQLRYLIEFAFSALFLIIISLPIVIRLRKDYLIK